MSTQFDPSRSEISVLLSLINGYRTTQAIHVAVVLGMPELLADGARSPMELAALTHSHAPSMERLLRALAAIGILREGKDARFALSPLGRGLAPTAPGSLNAWAKLVGSRALWSAWGELIHTVRTGETAFDHAHGRNVWDARRTEPEDGALFALAIRGVERLKRLSGMRVDPLSVDVEATHQRAASRSARICWDARRPGAPITHPPGWVPDPH
jgi:hypothetical protein